MYRRRNPSVEEQIVDANQQFASGALDPDEYQFLIAEALGRAPSETDAVQALFPHVREVARLLNIRAKGGPLDKAQTIVQTMRASFAPSQPSVEFVPLATLPAPAGDLPEDFMPPQFAEQVRAARAKYAKRISDVQASYNDMLITKQEAEQKISDLRAQEQQKIKIIERDAYNFESKEATARRQEREQAERAASFARDVAEGKAYLEPEYEEGIPVDVFQGEISEDDLYIAQKVMEIDERARANIEAEELFANDPEELEKLQRRSAADEEAADAFFKGLLLQGFKTADIERVQFRVWKALQAAALRMARRELRGRKDLANSAAELAAEAAVDAYFKLHHYKGRGRGVAGKAKVSSWVGTIVRNLARTLRQRQSAATVAGKSGLSGLAESLGFSKVSQVVTVRVQPGDTVESIAQRFYGTATKAGSIRKRNKIERGEQPKVGTLLKLAGVTEGGPSRLTGEAAELAMQEAEAELGTFGDLMYERMAAERLASEREADEMGQREDALVAEALQSLAPAERYILLARLPKGSYALPDGTVHEQTQPNDYNYIAQVLGVAKGTVMSRLSRAREKIFALLGDRIKPPYYGELARGVLELASQGRQGKVDEQNKVAALSPLFSVLQNAPESVPVLASPSFDERLAAALPPDWQTDFLRDFATIYQEVQRTGEARQRLSGVGPQPRKTGALPGVSGVVGRGEERIGFYQRDPSRRRANPFVPGMESPDFYYETPMDLLIMWTDGLINQEQYDTCMAAIDAELAAQAA